MVTIIISNLIFCKKVLLKLSEHGYVIIETQKIVFGYLSFNLARFTTMFGYFR